MPAGIDPETARQNWQAVRRMGRLYFFALVILPALAVLWFTGYGLGYFDGVQWARSNPASNQTKESNND